MKMRRGDAIDLVAPANVGPMLNSALEELRLHLSALDMKPRMSRKAAPGGKAIGLGAGRSGKRLPPPAAGAEGFHLRAIDADTLLLSARSARGLLNGAYDLLEALGVRWLTPEVTHFPRRNAWDLSGLDRVFEPSFVYRALRSEQSNDPHWAARHRLNYFVDHDQRYFRDDPRLSDSHHHAGADHYSGGKHCHNLYELLCSGLAEAGRPPPPIEEVFARNPEYFTLFEGQRFRILCNEQHPRGLYQSGQLCLTHPEVRRLLAAGLIRQLDDDPEASIIGFSLRDNYHYCQCDACRRETERQGGFNKVFFDLANEVAATVARRHPDKLISILAYHGTQKPPRNVKLHPNVLVYYCPIVLSQYHAWDEGDHNTKGGLDYQTPPSMVRPVEQLRHWRGICSHLVVWYYTLVVPSLHAHPSLRAHDRNLRLMREQGVDGVFIEDNRIVSQGSFKPIRAYVLARLLWNPDLDLDSCIREFIRLYYGPAADLVDEYVRLVHTIDMWDWENWPNEEGVSKWATRDYSKACWGWYNEKPEDPFPTPHFFTTYGVRPPLKKIFFDRALPLFEAMQRCVGKHPRFAARIELLKPSLLFTMARNLPPDDPRRMDAVRRIEPLIEEIRARYKTHPKVQRILKIPVPCPASDNTPD